MTPAGEAPFIFGLNLALAVLLIVACGQRQVTATPAPVSTAARPVSTPEPVSVLPTPPPNTGITPVIPTPAIGQLPTPVASGGAVLWSDGFESPDWMARWHVRRGGEFGIRNVERIAGPSQRFPKVLRVHYLKGSASPTLTRSEGAPVGGAQFYANLGLAPSDSLHLRYYVRFSEDFEFVKGGKLPGLFGGTVHSGGRIPDGTNGFSTRYMWRAKGDGEIYVYLPTSVEHGTSLGRGNWRFEPGKWHVLEQRVVLNVPGQRNGHIRVWVDENLLLDESNLLFRTTETLKIEGVFFSTFFGGDDSSWATHKATYVDFANFAVSQTYIGR